MGRNTLTRGLAAALAGTALVLSTAGACGPAGGDQAPQQNQQQQQGGDDGDGDDQDGDDQDDD
ncbi:DNA primase [Pseudonocardia endophytica]|uniref:DNA primase n=1 Tax=Pseudonocardia endophytica TaxID=401976 RepID=UPI001047B077|nr:DNA primase [Pseudonocardia endophytica]